MEIRPYQTVDQDSVVNLWRACDLVVPWNDPVEDIARKVAFQPDLFLVGLEQSALVGTVMAGYDGHRGWINYLAVDPRRRGNGLGRALMDAAETRLRAVGCPKINLQVRRSNAEVGAMYERLGFVEDNVLSLGKRLVTDDPNV